MVIILNEKKECGMKTKEIRKRPRKYKDFVVKL